MVRGLVALTLLMFVAPVCTDLVSPKTGLTGKVVITYMQPIDTATGKVIITVGKTVQPIVQVQVGSSIDPRARVIYRSLHGKTNVVSFPNGTSIHGQGLGTDTLIVSLAGVTIDSASASLPGSQARIIVVTKAATEVLTPATQLFGSINDSGFVTMKLAIPRSFGSIRQGWTAS